MDPKTARRVRMFAGKAMAEGLDATATDDAMREAFARCVRPVSSDLYPLIRCEILRRRMDAAADESPIEDYNSWSGVDAEIVYDGGIPRPIADPNELVV